MIVARDWNHDRGLDIVTVDIAGTSLDDLNQARRDEVESRMVDFGITGMRVVFVSLDDDEDDEYGQCYFARDSATFEMDCGDPIWSNTNGYEPVEITMDGEMSISFDMSIFTYEFITWFIQWLHDIHGDSCCGKFEEWLFDISDYAGGTLYKSVSPDYKFTRDEFADVISKIV